MLHTFRFQSLLPRSLGYLLFTRFWLILCLLAMLSACKNDSSPKPRSQEGIVGYWSDLKKYAINVSVPGTYDSQYTYIIQNKLGTAFQQPGLKVVFSGRAYKDDKLPRPSIGGQELFWLKLTAIQKK